MLKPYDGYKETNIPWLTEIPSHWSMLRNKNVLFEQKELVGDNAADYTLLSLTLNGVIARDMESGKGKFPKEFNSYKVVNKDNIIFCLFDVDETPRTVGLSNLNGMITGAYDVFVVKNINKNYLYYYYLSVDNAKDMKPLYTGLRKVIGVPKFLGTKLPVPPREEQDQIVKYLDWQTSKINTLIKAKKKQIELLKEQKQAVINKAVTKGLDDTVPMKDSGVEWLGEVPEHWQLIRNKNIVFEKNELVGQNSTDFDLLSLTIKGVILRDILSGKGKFPKDFDTYKVVQKGNIILCLFDIDETPRTIGISDYDGMITGAYDVFEVENINSYYLYYYYLAIDNKKALKPLYTGLRKIIGVPKFLRIKTPFPPFDEQQAIVTYLEQKTALIDKAIAVIEKEIELVSEYKTSIISSVVTGKVDVRSVAVPEFEVVEEMSTDIENDDEGVEEKYE